MRKIHDYNTFVNEMSGYGEEPFFFAKNGDQSNYLFKIEDDQDGHRGIIISIGKFSKFTQPTDAKTDYGVISINEMAEEELDQAVTDKGEFEPNDRRIEVTNNSIRRIMDTLTQVVEDYLENNPKVNKFYDEMQDKITSDLYEEKFKDSVGEWPGEWHFQEIEKGKLNLISK